MAKRHDGEVRALTSFVTGVGSGRGASLRSVRTGDVLPASDPVARRFPQLFMPASTGVDGFASRRAMHRLADEPRTGRVARMRRAVMDFGYRTHRGAWSSSHLVRTGDVLPADDPLVTAYPDRFEEAS